MDNFKYSRWINTKTEKELYQKFWDFWCQNYNHKMGLKFCRKWWLFLPVNEIGKHYTVFPSHELITTKTIHNILKIAKEIGFLKDKESGKELFLPGMAFERHPPLVLVDVSEQNLIKQGERVCFRAHRQFIESGINMKLIKRHNKEMKEYKNKIKGLPEVIHFIKNTTERLDKFYLYAKEKRKRDLAMIRQTIVEIVGLIKDNFEIKQR